MSRRLVLVIGGLLGVVGTLVVPQPTQAEVVVPASRPGFLCVYPLNQPPGVCLRLPQRLPLN